MSTSCDQRWSSGRSLHIEKRQPCLKPTNIWLVGRPMAAFRVMPVRPSVCVTRKQKNNDIKIGVDVTQSTSKWNANFQMKRSKVKVTGRQKTQQQSDVMFTYGQLIERPLLRRRQHGGRGLEFRSVTQPIATVGRPHTMSAPTRRLNLKVLK